MCLPFKVIGVHGCGEVSIAMNIYGKNGSSPIAHPTGWWEFHNLLQEHNIYLVPGAIFIPLSYPGGHSGSFVPKVNERPIFWCWRNPPKMALPLDSLSTGVLVSPLYKPGPDDSLLWEPSYACRVFSSIPGPYPLDATLQLWNQKYLQTLLHTPWRFKIAPTCKHCFKHINAILNQDGTILSSSLSLEHCYVPTLLFYSFSY